MAILRLKPRHASDEQNIAAVLTERIDYGKNPEKTDDAYWSLATSVPRKQSGRNLPFLNRSTPPPPGAGVPLIRTIHFPTVPAKGYMKLSLFHLVLFLSTRSSMKLSANLTSA